MAGEELEKKIEEVLKEIQELKKEVQQALALGDLELVCEGEVVGAPYITLEGEKMHDIKYAVVETSEGEKYAVIQTEETVLVLHIPVLQMILQDAGEYDES